MKYPYIAFDVDGTLLDALPVAIRTLHDVLLEMVGREYPTELLRSTMGLNNEAAFALLGLDYSEEIVSVWTQRQIEAKDQIKIFPGIPGTLAALRAQGCTLGIVTSRTRAEYDMDRELLAQIDCYCKHIVLSEMTQRHKPNPDPLLKFMELCGAEPRRTLYVGDTKWDMQCAAAAGAGGCLALWGALDPNTAAEYRISTPKDLCDIVFNWQDK